MSQISSSCKHFTLNNVMASVMALKQRALSAAHRKNILQAGLHGSETLKFVVTHLLIKTSLCSCFRLCFNPPRILLPGLPSISGILQVGRLHDPRGRPGGRGSAALLIGLALQVRLGQTLNGGIAEQAGNETLDGRFITF